MVPAHDQIVPLQVVQSESRLVQAPPVEPHIDAARVQTGGHDIVHDRVDAPVGRAARISHHKSHHLQALFPVGNGMVPDLLLRTLGQVDLGHLLVLAAPAPHVLHTVNAAVTYVAEGRLRGHSLCAYSRRAASVLMGLQTQLASHLAAGGTVVYEPVSRPHSMKCCPGSPMTRSQ